MLVNLSESRTPIDRKTTGAAASTIKSSKADNGNTSGLQCLEKADKRNKSGLTHNQITSTCQGQFNYGSVRNYPMNINAGVSDGADIVDGEPPSQLNSKNTSQKTKKSRHKKQQSSNGVEKNRITRENIMIDQTCDGNPKQKLKAPQATRASDSLTPSEKQFKNSRKKKKSGTQNIIPSKDGNNVPLSLGKGTFGSNCSFTRHRKSSTLTFPSNPRIPEGASSTPNLHFSKPLIDAVDQKRHPPSTDSSSTEGQTYPSHQENLPEIHSPEVESQQASPQADLPQLQSLPVDNINFPQLAVVTAAESHLTQSLPPMFNPEGFTELPMIQAVLQMGEVSYDSVVNTICTRYNTHGDTFPDAQSLLSSILDSDID
ncbi:hypothetical protein SNE40_009164 [Patella caerulea]